MRAATLAILVLLVAPPLVARAPGEVSGRAESLDGDPLAGVTVSIVGTNLFAITGAAGDFRIESVPAGSREVLGELEGFTTAYGSIDVTAGETASLTLRLGPDLLQMDQITVTGHSDPRTKLESSVAISTLTPEEIDRRVVQSSADLLKFVPGLWVEDSGGESTGNIWVRGFPQDGGWQYLNVLEDGLPILAEGSLGFWASPDQYYKVDPMIESVEAVRGGTTTVFSGNFPGALVQLITKTGGSTTRGLARLSAGSPHDLLRTELTAGGPIGDDWRYQIGGLYRRDDGIRSPAFGPANDGAQVRANATRFWDSGYLRLRASRLDDAVIALLEQPYIYRGAGKIGALPGYDLDDGTFVLAEPRFDVFDPFQPGRRVQRDLSDGMHAKATSLGIEWSQLFGRWSVVNLFRYSDHEMAINGDFNVADLIPGAALPFVFPLPVVSYTDGTPIPDPAALNGNGFINPAVFFWADREFDQVVDEVRLSRSYERHALTLGASYYRVDTTDVEQALVYWKEVRDNPRRLDIALFGGAVPFTEPGTGVQSYSAIFVGDRGEVETFSLFAVDEWTVSDRLRLSLGWRWDSRSLSGTTSEVANIAPAGGFDGNPVTGWDNVILGPVGRVPFDDSRDEWAASLGLNYSLGGGWALFGRATRGYRTKTLGDFTGPNPAPEAVRSRDVIQSEIGAKFSGRRYALFSTLFYTTLSDQRFGLFLPDPANPGAIVAVNNFGDTRTIGVEVEAVARPVDGLELRLQTTFNDVEYERLDFDVGSGVSVDLSGNQGQRLPEELVDLGASYTTGAFSFFGSWRYYGDRWSTPVNAVALGSFSEASAGVAYDVGDWSFALRSSNLTDELALTSGNVRGDQLVTPGSDVSGTVRFGRPNLPRAVVLSVTRVF